MNFTISKNEFLNALQTAAHAVSSTSPQVSLRGIKIEVTSSKMILTGSNADISIVKTIQANDKNMLNVIEEGSLLLDTRIILDIVKKIDSESVHVEIIDGAFTKFSGNLVVFKINGMNAKDYPNFDFSKPADTITMKASLLKEIIDQTTFAASIKETRPVLTGVNFRLNDGNLVITATDSYRLSRKNLSLPADHSFNITIPSKSLNEIKNTMLDEDKDIEIAINSKKAQFITEDTFFQTKLLDGAFPDIERMIPKEFCSELVIDREDLIHAVDRTIFIRNDNIAIVRLQCSADEIVMTNKSQEIGESHEDLKGKYTGEPLDISFSGNYVLDAAKALSADKIAIKFTGVMKPFILTDLNDDSILQLVLPVRTYN